MELLLDHCLLLLTIALLSALAGSTRRAHEAGIEVAPHAVKKKPIAPDKEHELRLYKGLYYKLHNLERHVEILPEARSLLKKLLSQALQQESRRSNTILSIDQYSDSALESLVRAEMEAVTMNWRHYLARRKQGQPREMFPVAGDARRWLIQQAPLKFVDGAWLGHIHKTTTPYIYRRVTKAAWQVLSEELGDGDLAKCHAHIYAQLLSRIHAPAPAPDSEDFTRHPGMDDVAAWRSALAQLLISLFPDTFLPEILGFNLNFEMMTLETLIAAKELREVGIDPYYFTLHISIDNADTGHTAMASRIVSDYLGITSSRYGSDAAQQAWKRVQAGFVLSKSINQPSGESLTTKVIDIFLAKSLASHGIHECCPLTIGGKALSTWLDPALFCRPEWQVDFLRCLGEAKPWVYKGDSRRSRLIHQLSRGGSMFGAFTDREVAAVTQWINSLAPPGPGVYEEFAGNTNTHAGASLTKLGETWAGFDAAAFGHVCELGTADIIAAQPLVIDISKLDGRKLVPIWLAHTCLLESFISVPWSVANDTGCAIVRFLRAQHGFGPEPVGVDGMDEMCRDDHIDLIDIGLHIASRADPEGSLPETLEDALKMWPSAFAETMLAAAARPRGLQWVLVGMAQAFLRLHEVVASSPTLLSEPNRTALRQIACRERRSLSICIDRLSGESDKAQFYQGFEKGLEEIKACFEQK